MSAGNSFSFAHERIGLPSEISLMEWCPSMDLIALMTREEGNVIVHRYLSWQKLYTITVPTPSATNSIQKMSRESFTTLAWRTDGNVLVCGSSHGCLSFFNVENGEHLKTISSVHAPAAITCMQWLRIKGSYHRKKNFAISNGTFCPSLIGLPPSSLSSMLSASMTITTDSSDLTNSSGFSSLSFLFRSRESVPSVNFLVSGASNGTIAISVFGLFCIAFLEIGSVLIEQGFLPSGDVGNIVRIITCCLSNDLQMLSVIAECEQSSLEGVYFESFLVQYKCSLLFSHLEEVEQVAIRFSSIEAIMEHISSLISFLDRKWKEALSQLTSKFEALEQLCHDQNINTPLSEQLLSLLICGLSNSALKQFLLNTLNEAHLKRLRKSFELIFFELKKTIVELLQPAAEVLVYRCNEFHALAKWTERFSAIGLENNLSMDCLHFATILFATVERLLIRIVSIQADYDMFFRWLLKLQIQFSETEARSEADDTKAIDEIRLARFLEELFSTDEIGQFFVNIPGSLKSKTSSATTAIATAITNNNNNNNNNNPKRVMFSVAEQGTNLGFETNLFSEDSLTVICMHLHSALKAVTSKPLDIVSKSFVCLQVIPLFNSLSSKTESSSSENVLSTNQSGLFAFHCNEPSLSSSPKSLSLGSMQLLVFCPGNRPSTSERTSEKELDTRIFLVRSQTDSGNVLPSSSSSSLPSLEVAILRFEDDCMVRGFTFYNNDCLAVLFVKHNSKDNLPESNFCLYALKDLSFFCHPLSIPIEKSLSSNSSYAINSDHASFSKRKKLALVDSIGPDSTISTATSSTSCNANPLKWRTFPRTETALLSVSSSRAVASIYIPPRQLTVLDLESNEETNEENTNDIDVEMSNPSNWKPVDTGIVF